MKAVIYDCDGVLVDSHEVILAFYDWLLDAVEIERNGWTDNELREKALSMSEKDLLKLLSGGDEKLLNKMLDLIKMGGRFSKHEELSLQPDLIESLDIVKNAGVPLAVFTNRGSSLHGMLKHFNIDKYFDISITSNDVEKPKPSPIGIFKICEHFNVAPQDVIFIGDAISDYEAAKSANTRFLAYKKPIFDAEILYNHKDIVKYL